MNPALRTLSRILAALVVGYAATVGLVALTSVALTLAFRMERSESIVLMSILGFLAYAAIILWGFAERRLARLWAILIGVAITSHLAAIWLADRLPPIVHGG